MSDLRPKWIRDFGILISKLNINASPSPDHLLKFISNLGNGQPLSGSQLESVVIALKRLELEGDSHFLDQLMLPDVDKILRKIDEFKNSDNLFAHPKVPFNLAAYGEVPFEEGDLAAVLRSSGGIHIEEFAQQENIVNRIAGMINESTMWASLNEY